MNITIEAVFKPLSPVGNLKEHDRVRLVVEPANLIDAQSMSLLRETYPRLVEENLPCLTEGDMML